MLAYRHARWFVVWLAVDIAVSLVLAASVGAAYLEWRAEHPWTIVITTPALAAIVWRLTR